MNRTKHIGARMGQRGISREMLDLVMAIGEEGLAGRIFIDRKRAEQILRTAKKILDKGGVELVVEGETMVTTYNYRGKRH